MSTAIIYATNHGTTEKVAKIIQSKLSDSFIELYNLRKDESPDLSTFHTIIIGGSIHQGAIQQEVRNFCNNQLAILKNKAIGLFICGMHVDIVEHEFNNAFPEELRNIAIAKAYLGGEFKFEKMNFIEKAIVRRFAKTNESISKIEDQAINVFVNDLDTMSAS